MNQKNVTDSDYEAYIINDSNYHIFYNYAVAVGDKFESIVGKLQPNTKDKIEHIGNEALGENLIVNMQIMFYDKELYSLREPYSKHLKIRSIKFYKESTFTENDFFDEFAFINVILEENAMKKAIEQLKDSDFNKAASKKIQSSKTEDKSRKFRKRIVKKLKEVDLHIHELIDDESGMSNHDKLKLQMDKFREEMQNSVKEKYEKVVFIHGVGSGSLKHELRNELNRKFKQYVYQDASFKEYGYGATMVILK